MTKEEILKEFNDINHMYNDCTRLDTLSKMLDELLKGHETVTEFADRCKECGREKVLDKVRAEIETLNPLNYVYMSSYDGHRGASDMKDDVLAIIDKYKTESEE